jgi:hypothetical protein
MAGLATRQASMTSTFFASPAPMQFFKHTNLMPAREFRYTEPVQMGRRSAKIAGRKV